MAASVYRASPPYTIRTRMPESVRSERRMMISATSRPPLVISTDPSHVDIHRLKDLYAACNISGHRFPRYDREGRVEPVDLRKLRIAVANSFVVVSVFCRPIDSWTGAFIQGMLPLTHWNGELVGFGRATSDSSLTASIHDVMVTLWRFSDSQVIPSLRRLGIGRMILKRLIRVLTSKDIYDIAALCDKNDRLFFGACGFGDDMLNSTTMMYARSHSASPNNAGRRHLIL